MSEPRLCPPYESVPTVTSHHGQLWAGTPESFVERLRDEFDYREDDVWLVSYPRSGTSWSYALLCAILRGGDIGALERAQGEKKVLKFLPIEVGSADAAAGRIAAWKALPSPRVIPTHLPVRLFPETALKGRGKRVYLVRHPKDVAVSFYHFHRSHRLLGFYRGTWDDFFECFITGQVIYGSWFEHTAGWLPRARRDGGGTLTLRYEEMRRDLEAQIVKISKHLNITLSPEAVAAIAQYSSFGSMSANPFTNRRGDPIMDTSITPFLRKGVVGDWRNHFTEAQSARFDAEWERWKEETEYAEPD